MPVLVWPECVRVLVCVCVCVCLQRTVRTLASMCVPRKSALISPSGLGSSCLCSAAHWSEGCGRDVSGRGLCTHTHTHTSTYAHTRAHTHKITHTTHAANPNPNQDGTRTAQEEAKRGVAVGGVRVSAVAALSVLSPLRQHAPLCLGCVVCSITLCVRERDWV